MTGKAQNLTLYKPGEAFGEKRLLRPMEECEMMLRQPGALSQVQAEAKARRAELVPPQTSEIALTVETLQTIFAAAKQDEAAQRIMVNIWVDLLAEVPAVVLQEALREWARKDTAFMPRPGEFLATCDKILFMKDQLARKAEALAAIKIEALPEPKPEPTADERARIAEGLRTMFKAVG